MTFRHVWRGLNYLALVALAGFFIAGCVIQDPPALGEIAKARKALDDAKKAGAADRQPDKFKELEKRFLQARGVFYACNDAEAARLAQSIIADLAAAPSAPAPAGNRPPAARLSVPPCGNVGEAVAMDASGSADPDGDALSYTWDFGDGTAPAKFTFPRATHTYTRAGNYNVRVTVDDGKGGNNTATGTITVIQKFVMTDKGKKVLFDFNKADLKPAAKQQLAPVLQSLREQPSLQTQVIGHTDGVGSDAYNMGLSQRRSGSVVDYLVQNGASRQNLKADWRGKREPIATNATAAGRAQNRRVEIILAPTGGPAQGPCR
ncbi:MAG: PKD domain-containing protein [Candidatus Tectomicrobia bacterium]|uniref:PKD domain-containing protein n=1 Tax=Tectimicrobiota bacterium TaxID=2528274 RepID=A0A937W677_UNCTE|nr:PKD domain-containing protein [Candidatus Tectomicrobia bacterium]